MTALIAHFAVRDQAIGSESERRESALRESNRAGSAVST